MFTCCRAVYSGCVEQKCLPAQFDGESLRGCTTHKTEAWKLILTFKSLAVTLCIFTYKIQQESQCAHNITLRHVRATIVAMVKQYVLHIMSVCVCSLRYPACNAYVPYCHPWPVQLYYIFPCCLITAPFSKKRIY